MADTKRTLTFSRPLLLLCAGILLATVVTTATCQRLIVSSLHERSAQYGQALADLAARQAIDATLNHDLVSLQVILSDVAENPDVAKATIHDVENNLLVQAGGRAERRQEPWQRNFSAPVTLQNSVAGYLTVTLDLTSVQELQFQLYWLFGFMAALLIALILSALYFGRSWNLPINMPRPAIPILDAPPEPESAPAESSPAAKAAFPRVELVVQFHNLRELAKQLDSAAFRKVSRRIEEQFRGILALYAGQLIQLDAGQARIAFANPELDPDAAFQAVCGAKLLITLNRQSADFPLRLSALVIKRASDRSILKNLQYQLAESDEYNYLLQIAADDMLLIDSSLVEEPALAAKIDSRPLDDFADILEVLALSEQYEQLLDKQLQQLRRS